ncbi:YueI family protein [Peribacillus kribbensis]|uniref:YueI family protein n=1 Tax=Peribacillus kribbensis TaxID=356658 RepID=UPI00041C9AAB|nr:YueI family protein [Peribacillus kribbensis]
MPKEHIDDYLQQGIHGVKEIKPEEKRKFLGTFRERVILALTIGQVKEKLVYQQVLEEAKKYPGATVLLNGSIPYTYLSKYSHMANKNGIPYKVVHNLEQTTDIGLVAAAKDAVDKEKIYVMEETVKKPLMAGSPSKKKTFPRMIRRVFSFWKKKEL